MKRRAPRLPQLPQVGVPTRSFELESLSSIEGFVNQPSKREIDSFLLGLQAITAHHLAHETIVQFHIGAHLYTIVHVDTHATIWMLSPWVSAGPGTARLPAAPRE